MAMIDPFARPGIPQSRLAPRSRWLDAADRTTRYLVVADAPELVPVRVVAAAGHPRAGVVIYLWRDEFGFRYRPVAS